MQGCYKFPQKKVTRELLKLARKQKLFLEFSGKATDKQKEIPVNPNDFVTAESTVTTSTTKRTIFRATKEQIMAAQKILKDGGMYAGEQTGKLDDATREGLKKYQAANGLNVTGTLNQVTLEKMGVPLTDKGFARKL